MHVTPIGEVNILIILSSFTHNFAYFLSEMISNHRKPSESSLRVRNVWQTAKPWDVLHESKSNTPPLRRYAYDHAATLTTWEVCVCVPVFVCGTVVRAQKPLKVSISVAQCMAGGDQVEAPWFNDEVGGCGIAHAQSTQRHTEGSTDWISWKHTHTWNTLSCLLPSLSHRTSELNKRMQAKGEVRPVLWMSQSGITASFSAMQTESYSDCPTSQAKGWKTFTCKYEWPPSYCEHASCGILKAQQPQKICHRGLANQHPYCNGTQALKVAVVHVGCHALIFVAVLATIVNPRMKQNSS